MAVPPVYLDECVDQRVGDLLCSRGILVTSVLAARTLGDDDASQLAFATQHDLVIVSHNTRDFRRLHVAYHEAGRPHGGILLLPTGPPERIAVRIAMLLDWLATFPDHRSQLFRWHELQHWLTQGNSLGGYNAADMRIALGQDP